MADCANCQKLTERLKLELDTLKATRAQADRYAQELYEMRGALRELLEYPDSLRCREEIAERFL